MYSHYRASILLDSKLLSYFIPRKVIQETVFPVSVISFDKNEMKLESFQYTLNNTQQNLFLCFENRFWLYGNDASFKGQEFSLCFQALDKTNKTSYYSKRKLPLLGYSSFFLKCEEDHCLTHEAKRLCFVKGRLLRLTKGGFIASCFHNPAFILRSSSFYKFRKHLSYAGWFSLNLSYFGFISYFNVIRLEKRIVGFLSKPYYKWLSQRFLFYYFRNKAVKQFLLLSKPRSLQQLV